MRQRVALGVRWTIGDVSERGFEALRLSLWGAWRMWGRRAAYAVCVNTVSVDRARALTGPVPEEVLWHDATREVPGFLRPRFDPEHRGRHRASLHERVGLPLRHEPRGLELEEAGA